MPVGVSVDGSPKGSDVAAIPYGPLSHLKECESCSFIGSALPVRFMAGKGRPGLYF